MSVLELILMGTRPNRDIYLKVLLYIYSKRSVTLDQVVDRFGLKPNYATKILSYWSRKGYIYRKWLNFRQGDQIRKKREYMAKDESKLT
ncbi:hypothetical protein [Metallosphaera sedula]|uniref:hypothetical protein n=1 Tax=Metallosphaera sedula TaxID=43687 RepID=UPI0020BFDA2E|nr:hypothetical protein [Metallosphaera sedula]BBL47849.1 hypothetical protein MJ1HA_1959 [Metallosphaera sedula]